MKQIVVFIVIFVLGAVCYAFLNPWLMSLATQDQTVITPQEISTTTEQSNVVVQTPSEEKPIIEEKVSIAPDGSLLDGPFVLFDAQAQKTDATVEIIRSPEETLLQFADFTDTHSPDDDIYLSTDLKASSYLSLGFAKLNDDVTIYGIPLDADLSKYSYILVYDVRNKKTEFSAKIK